MFGLSDKDFKSNHHKNYSTKNYKFSWNTLEIELEKQISKEVEETNRNDRA